MSSYERKRRHLGELKKSFRYDYSDSSSSTLREEEEAGDDSEPETRPRRRNRQPSSTNFDQCLHSLCHLMKNWCRKFCRPGRCWMHSISFWVVSLFLLKCILDYLSKPQNIFVVI